MADLNLGSAVHKPVTETTDDIHPNRLILTISQNILITILGFCVIKSISIGVLGYLKHLLHVCQWSNIVFADRKKSSTHTLWVSFSLKNSNEYIMVIFELIYSHVHVYVYVRE